jgi:hypothetical protein
MRTRRLRGAGLNDPLVGTAPIFKIRPNGVAQLIGTGFWITSLGHLVTAWHVIDDNIGRDGVDEGPIFAVQTLPNRTMVVRSLRKSYRHDTFDLALSETLSPLGHDTPTIPHLLTLDEPPLGTRVHTHSFLLPEQDFSREANRGISTFTFLGEGSDPERDLRFPLSFMARVGFGTVAARFPERRDAVMLPFPCFQSDIPLYGANSGGPVFDEKGRVCGINCTSYEGSDASFHLPIKGVLSLVARDIELIPEDPVSRRRSVLELGLAERVLFDPPLSKVFCSLPVRMLLWPYHRAMNWWCGLRWKIHESAIKADAEARRTDGAP